ncbi:YiaA/YiaB family inner membrane protein [Craurococcus roseus]|uniref:YiaA/YiaB family inner membrane protein n=1 Tax=Craurococcus roseus TaxID=77585 RepID=A0ABN1EV29_9PROT
MNNQPHQTDSGAWVAFTYVSFAASVAMVALGVLFLPVDLATRGYMAIGMMMLVQSSFTIAKTARDRHEGTRLHKRIEEARVEELLAKAERGA